MNNKPIAITMGCPAGIGPEIIIKLFHEIDEKHWSEIIVFGDINVLYRISQNLGIKIPIVQYSFGEKLKSDAINVLPLTQLSQEDFTIGIPNEKTGLATYIYLENAIKDALRGRVSAIVTAPISKKGLSLAKVDFPGHTEILASLTNTKDYLMMLAGKNLWVTLVTIHVALRDVPHLITTEKILKTIIISHNSLKQDFAINDPMIAVAGLNPHCGEDGLFGDEEKRIIIPAIEQAKEKGINVSGPFPPDTVFFRAKQGEFDLVVCMYHDQGLIPLKLLHFYDGVNITLNLPIIRTSVDHGTGYDIAGKGIASCESLKAALEMAMFIRENRNRKRGN